MAFHAATFGKRYCALLDAGQAGTGAPHNPGPVAVMLKESRVFEAGAVALEPTQKRHKHAQRSANKEVKYIVTYVYNSYLVFFVVTKKVTLLSGNPDGFDFDFKVVKIAMKSATDSISDALWTLLL